MDHKIDPRDTPPEDFYAQDDSLYIKLKYSEERDGFSVEVRNEVIRKFTPETIPEGITNMIMFTRGIIECGMAKPDEMIVIGRSAMHRDLVEEELNTMSDEEKKLFMMQPQGKA